MQLLSKHLVFWHDVWQGKRNSSSHMQMALKGKRKDMCVQPSGAPSDTTISAYSPSKWEMTSLAVTSLVMSPCICVTPSMGAIGCKSTATIFGADSCLHAHPQDLDAFTQLGHASAVTGSRTQCDAYLPAWTAGKYNRLLSTCMYAQLQHWYAVNMLLVA